MTGGATNVHDTERKVTMSDLKPVNREILGSKKFISMTKDAQALFGAILTFSDDEGCAEAYKVCEISKNDMCYLDELVQNGFVSKIYEDEAALIVYINKWHELNPDIVEDGEPSIWHDYIPLSAFT